MRWNARMTRVEVAKSVDWGSVPDWVGAVGTTAATVLLVIGLLREVRRRREDDEQQAADRRAALMRQARLVFGEVFLSHPHQIRAHIINGSAEPIFDVRVEGLVGTAADGLELVTTIRRAPDVTTLGGGKQSDIWLWLDQAEPAIEDGQLVGVRIDFTDAQGNRWRRHDEDQPVRVE
jgi:hypothetical protein